MAWVSRQHSTAAMETSVSRCMRSRIFRSRKMLISVGENRMPSIRSSMWSMASMALSLRLWMVSSCQDTKVPLPRVLLMTPELSRSSYALLIVPRAMLSCAASWRTVGSWVPYSRCPFLISPVMAPATCR